MKTRPSARDTIGAIVGAAILIYLFSGCATTQQQITSETTAMATQLMHYVPVSMQPTVASYVDFGAAKLRTINTASTSQEVVNIVLGFIPASIKANYPAIVTILTDTVKNAFTQYGAEGLGDVATGLETAMAPFLPHS